MEKKLKKCIAAAAASLISLLTLSSCMLVETGLVFSEDGETVTVYEETAFEKSLLDEMEMTPEDYYEALNESDETSYVGWEYEDSEFTKDGNTYINRRYYKICTYEEALTTELSERMVYDTDFDIEKTNKELNITVKYSYNSETSDEESFGDSEGVSYVFRIEAPFELIETNGVTEQEYDKKTEGTTTVITWDYTDIVMGHEAEKTFTVSFKLPDNKLSVIVACCIIGAVVIICVVAVVIVLKRKEKTDLPALPDDMYAPSPIPEKQPEPAPEPEKSEVTEPSAAEIPEEKEEESQEAEEKEPEASEKVTERKFCPFCGVKYEPNGAFCTNCGEPKTK